MEAVSTPRWLADEMLGRLARYLRFFGHDVEYVRGLPDAEISRRAQESHRTLLTRDRSLAGQTPGSILLTSPEIGAQLREVRVARPHARYHLVFDRCSECNAELRHWVPPPEGSWPEDLPIARIRSGLIVFECPNCGRRFWEGSHTEQIRHRVRVWLEEGLSP